jgi:hypothetical protein
MQPLVEVLTNPQWQWAALAIFGTAIMQVAAAVWVAGSRRHWFLRALVLWGAIALLVPIRAYEPALLFAICSPLTVAIVLAWQAAANRWRPLARSEPGESPTAEPTAIVSPTAATSRSRFHFRLLDLFLLMAIVGLWLAVVVASVRNVRVLEWSGPIRYLAAFTIAGIAAYGVVFGERRRFWSYAAAAGATWAAVYLLWNSSDWLGMANVAEVLTLLPKITNTFAMTSVVAMVAVSWFVIMLGRFARSGSRPLGRPLARGSLLLLAITTLPFWGILYWHMLGFIPLPPAIADEPNHYARILRIAEEVTMNKQDEHSLADLRAADPNSETADRLEQLYRELLPLLNGPNHVVLPPATRDRSGTAGFSRTIHSVQMVRSLSRSLNAEAGVAAAAEKLDVAVGYDLGNVRLGAMFSRGGSTVDYLVGVAVEGIGTAHLTKLRSRLSNEQARRIIDAIDRALAEHDSPDRVLQRDLAYWERWEGWTARLEHVIASFVGLPLGTDSSSTDLLRRAKCRLLQVDLALRMYRHDNGRWPDSLDELLPAYLPAVPLDSYDSYSEQPLRYRREGDEFVLYSVGQDGVDNGGRFGNTTEYLGEEGGYDLDLDTYSRP